MAWETIIKSPYDRVGTPNLLDYQRERLSFSWDEARKELDGLPGGKGLNIAHEAVDRHATGPRGGHLAIHWLGKHGETREFTYGQLRNLTHCISGRSPGYASRCQRLSMSCWLVKAMGNRTSRARMTFAG